MEAYWGPLGASWKRLGASCRRLGGVLALLGGVLEASWGRLGTDLAFEPPTFPTFPAFPAFKTENVEKTMVFARFSYGGLRDPTRKVTAGATL